MDKENNTTDYSERVADLFRRQGFSIEEHDQHILASKEGTSIHLFPLPDAGADAIREAARQADSDSRTVIFTRSIPEDTKADIEDKTGTEISILDPSEDKNEVEKPSNMPSSYEIIGDIAVLNLDEIPDNSDEIVEALIQQNPSVETVIAKTGQLAGEFRVGEYTHLYGDGTETTHTEHECQYRVDPTEVYFSERLGHERERISDLVQDGEHVHVWFAGVGPYAVLIAQEHDVTVDAIEKNPAGHQYMEENIELNGVQDTVTAHEGDVRDIAPDLERPDRIIMPLPGSADAFLPLALEIIRPGGTIHYYRFSDEDTLWEAPSEEIEAAAQEAGREVTIEGREICGHRSPYTYRVCLDVRVD